MSESDVKVAGTDKRRERRYPCVGIALVYSAVQEGNIAGLGAVLRQAALTDMSLRGLSFDVEMPLAVGQTLVLLIEQPGDAARERVASEVRWCVRLGTSAYRVGVRIEATAGIGMDEAGDSSFAPIGIGPAMPVGAELRCPACGRQAKFSLVGQQAVGHEGEVMPLYDCDACGSTRSMTGVFSHSRQQMAVSSHDRIGGNGIAMGPSQGAPLSSPKHATEKHR